MEQFPAGLKQHPTGMELCPARMMHIWYGGMHSWAGIRSRMVTEAQWRQEHDRDGNALVMGTGACWRQECDGSGDRSTMGYRSTMGMGARWGWEHSDSGDRNTTWSLRHPRHLEITISLILKISCPNLLCIPRTSWGESALFQCSSGSVPCPPVLGHPEELQPPCRDSTSDVAATCVLSTSVLRLRSRW